MRRAGASGTGEAKKREGLRQKKFEEEVRVTLPSVSVNRVCTACSVTSQKNGKHCQISKFKDCTLFTPEIEKEGQESKISRTLQQPSTSCLSFSNWSFALNRRRGDSHKLDRKTGRLVIQPSKGVGSYSAVPHFQTLNLMCLFVRKVGTFEHLNPSPPPSVRHHTL